MNKTTDTLLMAKQDLFEIASKWNGKDAGVDEDNASAALEAIEKIGDAIEIINEIK